MWLEIGDRLIGASRAAPLVGAGELVPWSWEDGVPTVLSSGGRATVRKRRAEQRPVPEEL